MTKKEIYKTCFFIILNIAVIGFTRRAAAFPLPTLDISRLKASIENTMHAVQEIKQEIESNIRIIEEIQNGGYMAAAGDLFGKIQNGDYDRFGQNVKGIGLNTVDFADTFGAAKREKNTMKEEMAKGLSREQALEVARQKEIQRQQERQEAQYNKDYSSAMDKAVKRRAKELKNQNKNLSQQEALEQAKRDYEGMTLEQLRLENQAATKLGGAYRWMQDNSMATSAGLEAIEAARQGDWSHALASAGAGVGSGVAYSGNEAGGALVQSGSALIGAAADAAQAGSLEEAYQALKYNYGGALDNLAALGEAAQDYSNTQASAEEAAEAEYFNPQFETYGNGATYTQYGVTHNMTVNSDGSADYRVGSDERGWRSMTQEEIDEFNTMMQDVNTTEPPEEDE